MQLRYESILDCQFRLDVEQLGNTKSTSLSNVGIVVS